MNFSLFCAVPTDLVIQPINTAVEIMIHGFILEQLCIGIRKNGLLYSHANTGNKEFLMALT